MSIYNEKKEFVNYILDLMQLVGPVNAKAMFGGYGIFLNQLMFGLVADSVVYLKADKQTKYKFEDRGLEAFTYNKKGKEFKMSYYQVPEEALEDIEQMRYWANQAYNVALKAADKK